MRTSIFISQNDIEIFQNFKVWCDENQTTMANEFRIMMHDRILTAKQKRELLKRRLKAIERRTEQLYNIHDVLFTRKELVTGGWTKKQIEELEASV